MSQIESLADIEEDLAAGAAGTGRLRSFHAQRPDPAALRELHEAYLDAGMWKYGGGFGAMHPKFSSGRYLISLCSPETRTRYRTLLWLERSISADNDFGFLIAPACIMLEAELTSQLIDPARRHGAELVGALCDERQYARQGEVLSAWLSGEVPTTIGIASLVLLALRKALQQQRKEVAAFLHASLTEPFLELLQRKKLGQWLDTIRSRFRNPACHGTTVFGADDYAEFAYLAVYCSRFENWDTSGAWELDELRLSQSNAAARSEQDDLSQPTGGIFHVLLHRLSAMPDGAKLKQYEQEWEEAMSQAR